LNQNEKLKINPSTIEKILLVRLRRIGDVIMTTPAITALREYFPGAWISYVVEEPYQELVENNPHLNEIIVIPPNQTVKSSLCCIRQIRKKHFDVAIDFHGGPRASLMTFLSGARLKIGYKIKHKPFIYDIKLPRRPQKGHFHSVESHLNLVKALGVPASAPLPLCLPDAKKEEVQKISSFLSENGLNDSSFIVMHIGAGNTFRHWGVDNFVRLINLISNNQGIKIILVGTKGDIKFEEEIIQQTEQPPLSAVGKLNLLELKELISRSSLFFGPDSGPMHIAASTSTPIVAYFGPTLPVNFSPWKANAILIEKNLDCRPCKQRQCIHKDFRCLSQITPEEVYNKVKELGNWGQSQNT